MSKMKKILPLTNAAALVLTVAVNYISSSGLINGYTIKSISDKYPSYFTPAGFAFSIWGLIYLGLFGFIFFTGIHWKQNKLKADVLDKIGWWFVLSCLANSFWVIAWVFDYTGISVLLMLILLFSLIKIIGNTRMELDAHPLKDYLFIYWPFALYSGWISVALIANISAYLIKIGWNGWGISEQAWAIVMVFVAGVVNILLIRRRNLREFGLVGIWALFAISVANKPNPGAQVLVYVCYGVMLVIFLFIINSGLKNKARTANSM
jgi:hypothetical protein